MNQGISAGKAFFGFYINAVTFSRIEAAIAVTGGTAITQPIAEDGGI